MKTEDKTSIVDLDKVRAEVGAGVPRAAYFIVLAGSQTGNMFKIERREMIIGRALEVAIRVDDDGVSRQHAAVQINANGEVEIRDLGSTNGTYCNGDRIDRHILQDGDKIRIGTTTILKFSYQDSLDEQFLRRQYESATRDALTNCYNKKYFLERLPNELASARRHQKPLSLAMLDVDFFKKVNDTYGHPAGDFVLSNIAKILQQSIRTEDLLSRYGGEEFALIMRETPAEPAFIVSERLRRKVEGGDFSYEDKRLKITVSIGVSTLEPEDAAFRAPDAENILVKAADEFLYKAKSSGRNRTESKLVM